MKKETDLTREQKNFIWDNHGNYTQKEITKLLGISNYKYYKFRKNYLIDIDLRNTVTKEKKVEVMDYFLNNWDNRTSVISKKFGLSVGVISKIINDYFNEKRKDE